MLTKDIIQFSGLLDKICPLLEEAGFEVTGITETVQTDRLTGNFRELTGEFTIRILPKSEPEADPSMGSTAKNLLNCTLSELVVKFKNFDNMEQYVKMLKDLTDVEERDRALRDRKAAEARRSMQSSGLIQPGNHQDE